MRSNLQRLTVPALTGGISTQPEGQRYPNQTAESINVNLDLVRGLEKRDGTKLEAVLDLSSPLGTVLGTTWVDRDEDEHYLVFATDSGLRIFNVAEGGVECSVTVDAAVDTAYYNGLTGFTTIADTTYCFNSSVEVETDPAAASGYDRNTTSVDSWSDLSQPGSIPTYRIVDGDEPAHPAGFYSAISTTVVPYWERVPTPEPNSRLLATTMPVRLRNTSKNQFTVDNPPWTGRLSGDSDTNPPPSFVGQAITGLHFWAGRLWVQAGQQIVGSRTDDLVNFWVDNITNLTDADPIDLSVGADTAQGITHVATYSNTMLVFTGASRQYELTSGSSGVVSPSTVSLRETTAYPQPTAVPVRLGANLYFPTNGGGSSRLYEYILSDGVLASVANDVAAHAFGYIPENVAEMISISETDQIFLRAAGSSDIFVYQQTFAGDQKVQNAVFKWQVCTSDDSVLTMDAVGSTLYFCIERTGPDAHVRIESVYTARSSDDVNQDDFDYPISLDGKQALTGVYDVNTGKTTWTTAFGGEVIPLGVLGEGWSAYPTYSRQRDTTVTTDRSGSFVEVTQTSTNTFEAPGDFSYAPVIFGRTVNMLVVLSQLYMRDEQGVPVLGTLQLKRMNVHYRNTGFFAVCITPPARECREEVFTAKQVGIFAFASNDTLIEGSGEFPVKVMSSAAGVDIRLTSDNPAPCNIPYIETLGAFVPSKPSTTNYR